MRRIIQTEQNHCKCRKQASPPYPPTQAAGRCSLTSACSKRCDSKLKLGKAFVVSMGTSRFVKKLALYGIPDRRCRHLRTGIQRC
eukprot:766443-Hanusia_phi.AAC.1